MSGAFRDNELARVRAVRERAAVGDTTGLVDAVLHFWEGVPERPDEPDEAQAVVWAAVEQAGALAAATEAGLQRLEAGHLLRPAAFIDVTEAIVPRPGGEAPPPELPNPAGVRLLRLAALALERDWPAYPYVAAIFARLVEGAFEEPLERFIREHAEALRSTTERWVAVGFVLTTSRVGSNAMIEWWFASWHERQGVPAWVLAAWLTIHLPPQQSWNDQRIHAFAARATAHAVPDETSELFEVLSLLAAAAESDEGCHRLGAWAARSALRTSASLHDAPLIVYANGIKRRHPVEVAQLRGPRRGNQLVAAAATNARGVVWLAQGFFPMVAALVTTPPRDPGLDAQMRAFEQRSIAAVPGLVRVWKRLLKTRLPWWRRLAAASRINNLTNEGMG